MIISRIEARYPNVLLVEKGVSSYVHEYLLAKEISLVLNVKRPLLYRIARVLNQYISLVEETSYVNLALMAKSDEAEVSSSRYQEILRKQFEREQEVIKAWKSSRDVHTQIAKVQGIESFCEEAWKKSKEKLDPGWIEGLSTDVDSKDNKDYPSKDKRNYPSKDKEPHPSNERKPISKAKLSKLNEKYGSVSKNIVIGESSQVKEIKRVNYGASVNTTHE
ncbi:hypothetical protein AgCh_033412 [Apium graveolens]